MDVRFKPAVLLTSCKSLIGIKSTLSRLTGTRFVDELDYNGCAIYVTEPTAQSTADSLEPRSSC